MFEGLSKRLGDVFDKLRGRGALSEADVDMALREVRTALLEADVALPVVRQFIDEVRPKAIGADVIRSVTPGQMASMCQVGMPATRRLPKTLSMTGSTNRNIATLNTPRR